MIYTNLNMHPTLRPSNTHEWLGLVTSAISDLRGTTWHIDSTFNISEIITAINNDKNFFTTVNNSLATKLNSDAYTATDVLAKVLLLDGPGSTLDADTTDGFHMDQDVRTTSTPSWVKAIFTQTNGIAPFNVTSRTKVANLNAELVNGFDFNQSLKTTDSPTFVGATLNQLTLSAAIGTAPFVVSSTTKVINLNVDTVDGYHLNQELLTSASPSWVRVTFTQPDGTAPFTITSKTKVANLNAEFINGFSVDQNLRTTDTPAFAGLSVPTITLAQNPVSGNQATTKNYVDTQIANIGLAGIPKLNSYQYTVTATAAGQRSFTIPMDIFDSVTDTLMVFIDTVFSAPADYIITNTTHDAGGLVTARAYITLNDPAGTINNAKVDFLVLKNVMVGADGSINGVVIATNTIPIDRVQNALDVRGGTMTGQLTSTVANGTTPFVISSTTKVINLNVDMVDGYHFDQDTRTSASPSWISASFTQAIGTAPFVVTSNTVVVNLNSDLLDGLHSSSFVQVTGTNTITNPSDTTITWPLVLQNPSNEWSATRKGIGILFKRDGTAAHDYGAIIGSIANANGSMPQLELWAGMQSASASMILSYGSVLRANSTGFGIKTDPSITLALVDNDSGFNFVSDGAFDLYNNNTASARFSPGTANFYAALQQNGRGVLHEARSAVLDTGLLFQTGAQRSGTILTNNSFVPTGGHWYRIATLDGSNSGNRAKIVVFQPSGHSTVWMDIAKQTPGNGMGYTMKSGAWGQYQYAGMITKMRVVSEGTNLPLHVEVYFDADRVAQSYTIQITEEEAVYGAWTTLLNFVDQGTGIIGTEMSIQWTVESWGSNYGGNILKVTNSEVVAGNNNGYTTKQLRNVIMSTADPSGGANGDIWIKYV